MAKKKKRTNALYTRQKTSRHQPQESPVANNESFLKKVSQFFSSIYGILTIVATLGTVYAVFFSGPITNLFKSKHDTFIDEKYIPGIFAPFYAGQTLNINAGGTSFSAVIPASGVIDDINPTAGYLRSSSADLSKEFSYKLKMKYHSFFLSITIRDIKTSEIIGEIEDNKWIIKRDAIKDYSDSNLLEIIDKYGYVAFSMWVDKQGTLQLRGYFVGENFTYFMNGNILNAVKRTDPNYIQKCEHFAALLVPRTTVKKAI
jgi:hypothetical protein